MSGNLNLDRDYPAIERKKPYFPAQKSNAEISAEANPGKIDYEYVCKQLEKIALRQQQLEEINCNNKTERYSRRSMSESDMNHIISDHSIVSPPIQPQQQQPQQPQPQQQHVNLSSLLGDHIIPNASNVKLARPKSAKQLERPWGAETVLGSSRRWKHETMQVIGLYMSPVSLPLGAISKPPTLDMGAEEAGGLENINAKENVNSNSLLRTSSEALMFPSIATCHSPDRETISSAARLPRARRRPMTGVVRQGSVSVSVGVGLANLGAQSRCGAEPLSWNAAALDAIRRPVLSLSHTPSETTDTFPAETSEHTSHGHGHSKGKGEDYGNGDDDDELRAIYRSQRSNEASAAFDRGDGTGTGTGSGTGSGANVNVSMQAHVRAQSSAAADGSDPPLHLHLHLNMLGKRLAKIARGSMERSPRESVNMNMNMNMNTSAAPRIRHAHPRSDKLHDEAEYLQHRGSADSLGSQLIDRRLRCELDALVPVDVLCRVTSASTAGAGAGAGAGAVAAEAAAARTSYARLASTDQERRLGPSPSPSPSRGVSELKQEQKQERFYGDDEELELLAEADIEAEVDIEAEAGVGGQLAARTAEDSDVLNASMDSSGSSSSGSHSLLLDSYGHTTCEESLSSSVDTTASDGASPFGTPARAVRTHTFKKKPRVVAAIDEQDRYTDAALLAAAQTSHATGKQQLSAPLPLPLPLPLCDFAIIQKDGSRDVRYVRASPQPA